MTIEYMAEQDCFKLKYTDAFKYVRARCNANVVEAVYAWLFGKTVEVNAGQQYMENNSSTTLGKQFGVALSTRKTEKTNNDTGKTNNNVSLLRINQRDLQREHKSISTTTEDLRGENDKIKKQILQLKLDADFKKHTMNSSNVRLQECLNVNYTLKTDIDNVDKQKDKKLTEMSAIAGNGLHKNNPGITNLDDPNRPMKLGEKFAEVYDNQWTDVMEQMEDIDKKSEVIGHDREKYDLTQLVNMLKEAQIKVKLHIKNEQKKMTNTKINELKKGLDDDSPDKDIIYNDLNLWEDETKSLKEYLNKNPSKVNDIVVSIRNTMVNEKYTKYSSDKLSAYLDCSIKLILFMEMQATPLVFAWLKENDKYDPQCFRAFTKSGAYADFIVWPALYLHEGGPLLNKGVVQPKPDQ